MNPRKYSFAIGLPVFAAAALGNAVAPPLEEVLIQATLRPVAQAEAPLSATVLRAESLRSAGEQHLAEVLALVPNLSAAGGTSRPRYFSLRGVGEREQYQGAPNPSVGFLIDDIDFSGVGMPATLIDVQQVEVLRGPQSLLHGANALAGLIHVRSAAPNADGSAPDARIETLWGDHGAAGGGVVADGGGTHAWRAVAQRYRSNGFRRNVHLNRADTNGYDERTARARYRFAPRAAWSADVALLDVELANGYDAWSIAGGHQTYADRPGRDAQHSRGASLRISARDERGEWLSVSSLADSRMQYSFDGDWGNEQYWGGNGPYDFSEQIVRRRRHWAEDLRFLSGDGAWLLGMYAARLQERQQQHDAYRDAFGPFATDFDSDFAATNVAAYGQRGWPLGARARLELGLRMEQRSAEYRDSVTPQTLRSTDRLWGGSLSWRLPASTSGAWYANLARGYKAGGYNIGAAVGAEQRKFRPEALWNLEIGRQWRGAGERAATLRAAAFAMYRADQQVEVSVQAEPGNPLLFTYLKENASGRSFGFELESQLALSARWQLEANLALLDARYGRYRFNAAVLDGARQALAPAWQANVALRYRHPAGAFLRLDWQGVAERYFGPDRQNRAGGHALWNLHAGFKGERWTLSGYLRNALNRRYALHGFYFGNEPPDFAPRLYLQAGDSRHLGLVLSYQVAGG